MWQFGNLVVNKLSSTLGSAVSIRCSTTHSTYMQWKQLKQILFLILSKAQLPINLLVQFYSLTKISVRSVLGVVHNCLSEDRYNYIYTTLGCHTQRKMLIGARRCNSWGKKMWVKLLAVAHDSYVVRWSPNPSQFSRSNNMFNLSFFINL